MLTNLRRPAGCSAPDRDPNGYPHNRYPRIDNFGRNLDLFYKRRDEEDFLKDYHDRSQFFMVSYLRSCHSRITLSGGRYDPGKHGNNHHSAFGCLYPRANLRGFTFASACDLVRNFSNAKRRRKFFLKRPDWHFLRNMANCLALFPIRIRRTKVQILSSVDVFYLGPALLSAGR